MRGEGESSGELGKMGGRRGEGEGGMGWGGLDLLRFVLLSNETPTLSRMWR